MFQTYKVDTLVWAKMKNYAPWPGLIADPTTATVKAPPANKNQVYHWIFFFGTANFAWIEETNLKPYEAFKDQMTSRHLPQKPGEIKKKSFLYAVTQIESYIKEKAINSNYKPYSEVMKDLEFDNLRNESIKASTNDRKRKTNSNGKKTTPKSSVPAAKKTRQSINDDAVVAVVSNNDISTKSTHSTTSSTENVFELNEMSVMDNEKEEYNLRKKAAALDAKEIEPLTKKIGFLGVGKMGLGFVKNLIHSGHSVTIWDRNIEKCEKFKEEIGAELADNPADVVQKTDIIFSCFSEPRVSKDVIYSNCGVKGTFNSTKGFIELSTMNTEVSLDISDPIMKVGGRYLEAQIQGDIQQATDGVVFFITAGDESLYHEVQSCFKAMGSYSFYISPNIGDACIMNLALQSLKATAVAGMAEALTIVDRFKLKFNDFFNIFQRSQVNCDFLKDKCQHIVDKNYDNKLTLKYMQKDLRLTLDIADQIKQPLPMAANANEIFKKAIHNGYGNMDASAIYEYIRH